MLTPPAKGTEQDDGLLTASEVAQLKLDADWVILSACNTAAAALARSKRLTRRNAAVCFTKELNSAKFTKINYKY